MRVETAEPVSRDQILRRERGQGKNIFPCSANHEQDSNSTASIGMNILGTPPRLTFQARLLHNREGANAEKGGFRKIRRELSLDVQIGVHIFLVVEQSSLKSQSINSINSLGGVPRLLIPILLTVLMDTLK